MKTKASDGIRRATLFALGLLSLNAAFARPDPLGKDPVGERRGSLQDQAAKAVSARLIAERVTLTPGKTNWIALTFDIAPKWHLYWHNAGDSGLPISFRVHAPEGVTVGEPLWPTPRRHVSAEIILDYIYEDRVTILLPVEVSGSAAAPPAGGGMGQVTIGATVEWLVCREACVPGGASVSASFGVGATGVEGALSTDAPRFAEARERIPVAHDPSDRGVLTAAFDGATLRIDVPGAESVEFFPYGSEGAQPLELIERGTAKGPRIAVSYEQGVVEEKAVRGVVEARHPGQKPRFWLIVVDPGAGS